MLASSSMAFKEWAAVCLALRTGRQSVIVRKGGIHEGRAGFRVAHQEFWLFPTYLHESPEGLKPDAAPLLQSALTTKPPEGRIFLFDYVRVSEVVEVTHEEDLKHFRERHVLSDETIRQRFYYRQPGLFVLDVEVFTQAVPHDIADEPRFGGCRSWVELGAAFATSQLKPVLR